MEDLIQIFATVPTNVFQALIDNIPSPVYYKDARGIYLIYNKAFQEYFGITGGQFIGKNIFELPIRREDAEAHHAIDLEILRERTTRMYELKSMRNDGIVHYELVRKASLADTDGKVTGIVGVIMDITEQKRMEEDIQKAKNFQSVSTLAGGIAHDFNNLLMAVVGNLALAKMTAPDDSRIVAYINEAERIIFLGKNLTQQLLAFSRGNNQVRNIIRLENLIPAMVPKLLPDRVQYTFNAQEGIFPIEADESQIKQVIENIIKNAIEAMPNGGHLSISLENIRLTPEGKLPLLQEDFVRLTIRDNGKGIPVESIPNIFNPYYTTKSLGAEKGVGLGLAISYTIIKKHNGKITLESFEGKGSIVLVDLPAYTKGVIVDISRNEDVRMRKHGSVLLLDDEEMVLEIGKELMEYLGYSVTTVLNGSETLALYAQALQSDKPFDVVILDLAIPGGMGGKEVIRELKRLDPNVKAIISSGYLTDPIVQNYREYGFMGVLTKPYNSIDLDDTLQKIIKG